MFSKNCSCECHLVVVKKVKNDRRCTIRVISYAKSKINSFKPHYASLFLVGFLDFSFSRHVKKLGKWFTVQWVFYSAIVRSVIPNFSHNFRKAINKRAYTVPTILGKICSAMYMRTYFAMCGLQCRTSALPVKSLTQHLPKCRHGGPWEKYLPYSQR